MLNTVNVLKSSISEAWPLDYMAPALRVTRIFRKSYDGMRSSM
jgi:hypothetical protein